MKNNIFSKKANNTFFVNIKNEIYECRFNKLFVQFEKNIIPTIDLKERRSYKNKHLTIDLNKKFETNLQTARYAELEVADNDSPITWNYYNCQYGFDILKIYKTADDCLNYKDALFFMSKYSDYYTYEKLYQLQNPIEMCAKEMSVSFAELEADFCFSSYYADGFVQRSKYIKTAPIIDEIRMYNEKDESLTLYDLVGEHWLLNDEGGKLYKAKEDCAKENPLIIHRFK